MFDIAIGIPSLNEAATIGNVVGQIDRGLADYFHDKRCIIVNADNGSCDGTPQVFLQTASRTEKRCLAPPRGSLGKGDALARFFAFAYAEGAAAVATVDGDLESIQPQWMRALLTPLFQGYDFVFPSYLRHRHDGAISSQFCFPLLAGVLGTRVRQPIAGEFGLSRRYLAELVGNELPDEARHFGVDIHLTSQAIMRGLRLCGVELGCKIHRRRDRATLGPMFADVAASAFGNMLKSGFLDQEIPASTVPPILATGVPAAVCRPVPAEPAALTALFRRLAPAAMPFYLQWLPTVVTARVRDALICDGDLPLDDEQWCTVVYSLLSVCLRGKESCATAARALVPLFFARLTHFVQETAAQSDAEVEAGVQRLADLFFVRRRLPRQLRTSEGT